MALELTGKVALITGAASGIGRETACLFARQGANIVAADRNLEPAEETAAEVRKNGRKAIAHQVEISDEAQVKAMVERAVRELGTIDILVAAAAIPFVNYGSGGGARSLLVDEPLEDWRQMMRVNLDGTFLTDRHVARVMIAAKKGGRIINIASGAAIVASPRGGPYSVSKAGVWMLTKTLAVELARHGITANAIAPGFIETPMTEHIRRREPLAETVLGTIPLRRFGKPFDIAATALFLASEEGAYYTGQLMHPNGGVVIP
ncbi:MAG TPA: SDR family NAD(P)-dependent oxidoreductase [Candidatus Binataceae bacterium]|jgi:3-oxoacyl-[acyl-carrier protein] reductase